MGWWSQSRCLFFHVRCCGEVLCGEVQDRSAIPQFSSLTDLCENGLWRLMLSFGEVTATFPAHKPWVKVTLVRVITPLPLFVNTLLAPVFASSCIVSDSIITLGYRVSTSIQLEWHIHHWLILACVHVLVASSIKHLHSNRLYQRAKIVKEHTIRMAIIT